jgi:hypothetical protein
MVVIVISYLTYLRYYVNMISKIINDFLKNMNFFE